MNRYELSTQAALLLADTEKTRGPEFGKASPIGLLVVVLLLIAVFLLIRSMNARLRNLPDSFDQEHPEPDQEFDEGTDTVVVDTTEEAEDSLAVELDAEAAEDGGKPRS